MATRIEQAEFPRKLEPLFKPGRYKVLYGGRGSGKSWGVARALILTASRRPVRILCTREVQESIKDSVHRLLSDQIKKMGLSHAFDILQTEIRGRNGSLFLFSGLSDQTDESIKSFEGVNIVWVEEAQSISEGSWTKLVPTIRAATEIHEGFGVTDPEIWMTLNPELETDPTYRRFIASKREDVILIRMNWRDNPWFPPVLDRERKEDKQRLPEDEYMWIWEGRPLPAVRGAIYHNEVAAMIEQGRIRNVPFDPLLKTHTIWDLGYNDSMAVILAQRSASEIRICKYIEDTHRKISDYVLNDLQPLGLNWGYDFLPHDGFAKNHQTAQSDADILRSLGRNPSNNPADGGTCIPNIPVEQGIRRAREVFPRIYIDESCERLIECLKHYKRNVSKKTGVSGRPEHDEFSHGADAFRYLCLAADQMTNEDWGGELKYQDLGAF